MNLPWGHDIGFDPVTGGPRAKVTRFLERHHGDFAYMFFAFQPRGAVRLAAEHYLPAYESLVAPLPRDMPIAFHHGCLNLGAIDESHDRTAVYRFTNILTEHLGFRWVVEDLGIWSLRGVPMPYPLPPVLTADSVARVSENVREAREQLLAPLHIEFPGFMDNVTFAVGDMDAYSYFAAVAEAADAWVTLDVGHLLSYRWFQGHRGDALFDDLSELPLDRCRELHLSGCTILGNRFMDLHHGVLLDEQIELCARLLQRCPQLIAVTYEDPRYDSEGTLIRKSLPNLARLREAVAVWAQRS